VRHRDASFHDPSKFVSGMFSVRCEFLNPIFSPLHVQCFVKTHKRFVVVEPTPAPVRFQSTFSSPSLVVLIRDTPSNSLSLSHNPKFFEVSPFFLDFWNTLSHIVPAQETCKLILLTWSPFCLSPPPPFLLGC